MSEAQQVDVGGRIRTLREAARMTMAELALAADVSQSLISQIERGLAEPSLATLRRVSSVLGVPMSVLFTPEDERDGEPAPATPEISLVVRRGQEKRLQLPGTPVAYELLVPNLARSLEAIRVVMPPGSRVPGEPSQHTGEEVILCLEGILVAVRDEDEFVLGPGDTIAWDPSEPHWIENRTDVQAVALAFMTPPSF